MEKNTSTQRFLGDDYYYATHDYDELLNETESVELASEWKHDISSANVEVSAFESIEAGEIEKEQGINYTTLLDTGNNTQLLLHYRGEHYCVSNTAIDSLFDTAKVSGSALSRVSPYSLALILNKCLEVAKGKSLLLYRGDKICACLSENIYKIMPIPELLKATKLELESKFGEIDFKEGNNSIMFTDALWELPEAQSELLDKYDKEVETHRQSLYSHAYMPAVRFITSDIGKCSATLIPMFRISNKVYFRLNDGIKVEHRKGMGGIATYKTEISRMFAKFNDITKVMAEMAKCEIANPLNALVLMSKKVGLPKRFLGEAYEDIEMFTNGGSCYMDDLFLAIASCTGTATRSGASHWRVLELEEAVSKIMSLKWSEYDIPGVVAW